MKKAATPTKRAAQEPIRTLGADPVCVAAGEPNAVVGIMAEFVTLAKPVEMMATAVLTAVVIVQEHEVSKYVEVYMIVVLWLAVTPADPVPVVIEPVPEVAAADPDADTAVGTVFPAAEQLLANACMAAFTFDPLQRLCICASTFVASEPQIVERSAGFGSVLIAANKHAGGSAAAAKLAHAEKTASRATDLKANIV